MSLPKYVSLEENRAREESQRKKVAGSRGAEGEETEADTFQTATAEDEEGECNKNGKVPQRSRRIRIQVPYHGGKSHVRN